MADGRRWPDPNAPRATRSSPARVAGCLLALLAATAGCASGGYMLENRSYRSVDWSQGPAELLEFESAVVLVDSEVDFSPYETALLEVGASDECRASGAVTPAAVGAVERIVAHELKPYFRRVTRPRPSVLGVRITLEAVETVEARRPPKEPSAVPVEVNGPALLAADCWPEAVVQDAESGRILLVTVPQWEDWPAEPGLPRASVERWASDLGRALGELARSTAATRSSDPGITGGNR